MKILVVDDDAAGNKLVDNFLRMRGYEVVSAHNGQEALTLAALHKPDLVLLDVMMPGMDGWQVMHHLRTNSDVPVLFISAKDHQEDVIQGLTLGANDYLRKPFSLQELELRVSAILRRTRPPPPATTLFDDGYLRIDLAQHAVFVREKPVRMSPTEYRLLTYLAARPGYPVPHAELLREVWGPAYAQDMPNLHVYIRYLREKLEADPKHPQYILTTWGVGYRFGS